MVKSHTKVKPASIHKNLSLYNDLHEFPAYVIPLYTVLQIDP